MAKKKQKKNEVAKVATDSQVAHELTAQYGIVVAKTGEMLREAVKFGSMLIEWGNFLGEARGSSAGSNEGTEGGVGLKGWLAEHCPEINYQTAMGYKHLAEKTSKMLGGGNMAIAALQGKGEVAAPDGEVVDVDAEVVEQVDEIFAKADSRRKLEQMYFEFSAGKVGRPGRPPSAKATGGKPISAVESARRLWGDIVYQVVKHRAGLYSAAKLLPMDEAEKSHAELKALCDALKARIDEK